MLLANSSTWKSVCQQFAIWLELFRCLPMLWQFPEVIVSSLLIASNKPVWVWNRFGIKWGQSNLLNDGSRSRADLFSLVSYVLTQFLLVVLFLVGMALRLRSSCPGEPYRTSIFRFVGEQNNFSVPCGSVRSGWDHLTLDHPHGILGMVVSILRSHTAGDLASLNCVYLLAPCRENLPINCILILSANF